jgi:leucyl aminopeptidase (aminopeptidase T)
MSLTTPDVSPRLKPEFLQIVDRMYTEMCNLKAGERVLVISDARTPEHIVSAFTGMAFAKGADAASIEARIPSGGATYQPGWKWTPMVTGAASEADLIIDLAVGYADFIAKACSRGARVLSPGDGIGCPFLDDVMIRTMLHADMHAMRRRADRIADLFTRTKTMTLHTGQNDVLRIDIEDLQGFAVDGFLWDMDREEFKTNYSILPPATPGVVFPKGRGTGTVMVDGTLLWHPVYHEAPSEPLRLTYDQGRLVRVETNGYLSNRLRQWLVDLEDEGAYFGPVHLNVGINPNALMTQHPEWERVMGSITCGTGDMGLVAESLGLADHVYTKSKVHWDWTVLDAKLMCDDFVLVDRGRVFDPK